MMGRSKLLRQMGVGALAGTAAALPFTVPRLPAIAFFTPDRALLGHRLLLLAAVGGWVLFGLYWEAAAKNASAAIRSESRASRGLHVFLVNAALLLEIAPIRGLGRWASVSVTLMLAGLAIEAGGLFLAFWARRHLGRNWSGEISIKLDHELIRAGPYRLLRHPIYTGLLAMYFGVALVTGEWLGTVGLALAVIAYCRKLRLEETNLGKAFGSDYEGYRRRTWALVPGIY